jgi:hypothetical protein
MRKLLARGAAGALMATAAITGAAVVDTVGPERANAATHNVTFSLFDGGHEGDVEIQIFDNGVYAGAVDWFRDPVGSEPGDTLAATDSRKDGFYIAGDLSTGRHASTAGHNAPYSDIKTGNLPEGQGYSMWASLVDGGTILGRSAKVNVIA